MDPAQASIVEWMLLVGGTQLPLLAVAISGLVVAAVKWKLCPKASRFVAVAFALLIVQAIATTARLALEVRGRMDARLAGESYVEQFSAWVLPISVLGLVGVLVLAAAVFVDRNVTVRTDARR